MFKLHSVILDRDNSIDQPNGGQSTQEIVQDDWSS